MPVRSAANTLRAATAAAASADRYAALDRHRSAGPVRQLARLVGHRSCRVAEPQSRPRPSLLGYFAVRQRQGGRRSRPIIRYALANALNQELRQLACTAI